MSEGLRGGWRAARLVPAAGVAWITAAIAVCAPAAAGLIAAGLWAASVAGLFLVARRRSTSAAVLTLAVVAGAMTASHVAIAHPARASVSELVKGSGRMLTVDAAISGKLQRSAAGDVWFDVIADRVGAGENIVAGPTPVRIGVLEADVGALGAADIGTRISVQGAAIPPDPGDRAVVILRARAVTVDPAPAPLPLLAAADLRRGLVASASSLPTPGAALVPGLAVGDTSGVDAALDESMKASSLSHLTAVSGANCALVVGIAFGLAALCGARRSVRVTAALVTLAGFVVLVTPEPSVVRAGMMAAIAMLAVILGRAGAGLSVLSLAVVVLLAVDPWLALSLGFALSTVATASLLVLARPLADGLTRWMPRALALALAVPLAAQLVCAPLLVLIDPHVPLLGVAANLLAAPAAPLATLAGFAGCLAHGVPVLQDGLVAIAWVPASWIAGIAGVVAAIPAQQLPWWGDLGGAITLAAVSAATAAVIALRPGRGRRRRASRVVALIVVGVTAGVGGGQVLLRTTVSSLTVPGQWSVAACDVGQGDAVLVRSDGQVALFDTGPDPALVEACLARFGIDRIDLLVLTHFDLDHVGGVEAVVGRVDHVLHGPTDGGADERMLRDLSANGAMLSSAHPGAHGPLGHARWRILWPAPGTPAGNDASVVIDVSGGVVPDLLLLGDLSAEAQRSMQRLAPLRRYDVVKVAHHGSADQDPGLYEKVAPAVALVTVGADNDYGHPRATLLDLLAREGATTARTDQDGAVALWRNDGGGLHLWRERNVAPAG